MWVKKEEWRKLNKVMSKILYEQEHNRFLLNEIKQQTKKQKRK